MAPSNKAFGSATLAFKSLACKTWRNLADRHYYNLHWRETSITDDIIYQLVKKNIHGMKIYQSISEDKYGHDIDLFIKQFNGDTLMLSLQAKVLYNHAALAKYKAIEHKVFDPNDKDKPKNQRRKINQWDLLDKFQKDRIPFYLFYNGFKDAKFTKLQNIYIKGRYGLKALIVTPNESLGCSVMLFPNFKKRFLETNNSGELVLKRGNNELNYFSIHQSIFENAIPWHELFNINKYNWIKIMKELNYDVITHKGEVRIDGLFYRELKVDKDLSEDSEVKIGDPTIITDTSSMARYCIVIEQSRGDYIGSSPLFKSFLKK